MSPSVDDYYSLLTRAASVLENGTAEARQELYDRARAALKAEFGKLDPPPSDKEALQERLKLDSAIHDFELRTGVPIDCGFRSIAVRSPASAYRQR
jgi:hypothetical protein